MLIRFKKNGNAYLSEEKRNEYIEKYKNSNTKEGKIYYDIFSNDDNYKKYNRNIFIALTLPLLVFSILCIWVFIKDLMTGNI